MNESRESVATDDPHPKLLKELDEDISETLINLKNPGKTV